MSSLTPIQEAFETTRREFMHDFKHASRYPDLLTFNTIEEIYNTSDKIQEEQGKNGALRGLRRIQPYLDRLEEYSSIIETFVQAKAEILALVWGPIKLLLQISSSYLRSFDAIIEIMANIGGKLPHFQKYAELFDNNARIQHVLCLFYKDVLDIHVTMLNFFNLPAWKKVFEAVWPKQKSKIMLIGNNIDAHSILMTAEVTLADISAAQTARTEALLNWRRNHEFEQRHDFQIAESYVSPRLYDKELDRLRNKNCTNTGNWLKRDKVFCKWLSGTDESARFLWLQGIPGAGKTHLSAAIVTTLKEGHAQKPLFVFLSYLDSQDTSPIDILHSLIFQLVSENTELQPIICNCYVTNRREMKNSTTFVRRMLSDLLECIGSAYIIVDGLDEIDEIQRKRFLHEFLLVWEDCKEMKVLISSRREEDIARVLRDKVQQIRIDTNNSANIRSYVSQRANEWLVYSEFDSQARAEIKGLLAPLFDSAKGMFLYARVVMDSLEQLHNLSDIRNEIATLPKNLYEAYGRILERIERLGPTPREEAKKILGWIGCSKTPFTNREILQALAVRLDERMFSGDRKVFMNIPRLCGPIVEVQAEYLQFVHFTVKEYLFNRQSGSFLNLIQANQDLAETCMSYLKYGCFDTGLSDETIDECITSGNYLLYSFAASQWLPLVQSSVIGSQEESDIEQLSDCLEEFFEERDNPDFNYTPTGDVEEPYFRKLKPRRPDVFNKLSLIRKFWYSSEQERSLKDGRPWVSQDPLTISASCCRIYQRFESLAKASSISSHIDILGKLQEHYVTRCSLSPPQSPFKCPVQDCEYATIGFRSRQNAEEHSFRFHKESQTYDERTLEKLDRDSIEALAFDVVGAGDLDGFINLKQRLMQHSPNAEILCSNLATLAASSSSLTIMKEIIEWIKKEGLSTGDVLSNPVAKVFEVDDIEMAKLISLSFPQWEAYRVVYDLMKKGSYDMVYTWLNEHPRIVWIERHTLQAFISASNNPFANLALAEIWKKRAEQGLFTQRQANECLSRTAYSGFSITLCATLLELGADINYRSSSRAFTPLQKAAQKTTREAADFMRFLLLSGADPTLSLTSTRTNIANEAGARNISKWLGMDWNELIEWARNERAKLKDDMIGTEGPEGERDPMRAASSRS